MMLNVSEIVADVSDTIKRGIGDMLQSFSVQLSQTMLKIRTLVLQRLRGPKLKNSERSTASIVRYHGKSRPKHAHEKKLFKPGEKPK